MTKPSLIKANWDAPENIIAFTTTRLGGVSHGCYNSLNLGAHCDDDLNAVNLNRQRLIQSQQLPTTPVWLEQVHGNTAIEINHTNVNRRADASYTPLANTICAILTADCLPILLCNQAGNEIAAIHAGWRSLAGGIIENTLEHFHSKPQQLLAWFGPAIGKTVYQVGNDVRDIFVKHNKIAKNAFIPIDTEHWLADLNLLAQQRLQALGLEAIYGCELCTYSRADLFFSYRRDGQTGRMANLIYRLEN